MSIARKILMGAAGAGSKTTYVDDVFSTYLYKGTGSPQTITNGIDLAGEGGMTWIKSRSLGVSHIINDTVRGAGNRINSNGNSASSSGTSFLSAFNSSGFSIGNDNDVSYNGQTFSSWSWRKQKGFFDVVTYTGNATTRTISHSLGSVPGLILIKDLTTAYDWFVYHKSTGNESFGKLNTTNTFWTGNDVWNSTSPTSTNFTINGNNTAVNTNTNSYVAYIFAGGASTAATARSVDFDGSDDQLNIPDSTDWDLGNGDFTLETWIKSTQTTSGYFTALGQWGSSNQSWMIRYASQDIGTGWSFFYSTDGSNYTTTMGSDISDGQWHHVAVTRTGGNLRTFTDGILNTTRSTSDTFYAGAGTFTIGGQSGNYFDGQLSNVRLVKGTALYTSSFRPPTKPLTNVTNTKLLCCNNSSVTGSTVTPGTITASSSPTASTDSPFDDPEGFKFGEGGDQNIIKTGSYVGNANDVGPEVFLGFEPQFLMVKNSNAAESWHIMDCMRGIVTRTGASNSGNGNENKLYADTNDQETDSNESISLTATGFNVVNSNTDMNGNGNTMIYMAIRRPDSYVGKPPEAGTDVFALARGAGNPSFPCFVTGFPVDFLFQREFATADSWITGARLTGTEYMYANATSAGAGTNYNWGSNTGAVLDRASSYQGWLWKRHAGFDVVAFQGTAADPGPDYAHSLGRTPELKFIKRRNSSTDWMGTGTVVSQAMAGNNNSKDYYLKLNSTDAATNFSNYWTGGNDTAESFTVRHGNGAAGGSADPYLCILFASVDGISKVGYYDGSDSEQTIITGFSPRFVVIKCSSQSGDGWYVMDTVRGWGSGTDKYLDLQSNAAQGTYDMGTPTSTGFTMPGNRGDINDAGQKYIYYAHA